jgi:ABC-2 type transport system permease protein
MNKMLLVVRREYLFNLRRPAFLFAVFGVPIFTFAMWAIIFLLVGANESDVESIGTVGYVDNAAILTDPVYPADVPLERFLAYPDEAAARQALDEKAIGAYFIIPENYLTTGRIESYSYIGLPEALRDSWKAFLLANLTRRLDPGVEIERIQDPVNMVIRAQDTGRTLTEANLPALIFIPLIFAFLFFMSSGTTSGFLMNGVVEEKTTRIMEILVTSVTPSQLLFGKIIGLGLLGLTQMVVWFGAGFVLIRFGQGLPALNGVEFPVDLMLIMLAYFLLSYFLLATLMAGLGVVAGSDQESRQYASIISLLFIIPFFLIASIIEDPNGSVALIFSLIPVTAPMTMLLRLGFSSVPTGQLIASLLILLLTAVLVAWASTRVFRWALLRYDVRTTLREILSVIRRPTRDVAVSAAHSSEEVG